MAVIKLSKSGKSVLFIDDSGRQFFTSVSWLNGLLSGRFNKSPFIVLKYLPVGVDPSRFPASELFDPNGLVDKVDGRVDGYSKVGVKDMSDSVNFVDKDVW